METAGSEIEELTSRVTSIFREVHRRSFLGDPAANPRLQVEVVEARMVVDTPCLILLTPWTLNGLAFPPDARFPHEVEVRGRRRRAYTHRLEGLGEYVSVPLLSNLAGLRGQEQARRVARALGEAFFLAVAAVRSRD